MWLGMLCVGLCLLAVGLFGVTEFGADLSLRVRGWLMIAVGVLMICAACYSLA